MMYSNSGDMLAMQAPQCTTTAPEQSSTQHPYATPNGANNDTLHQP